MLTKEEEKVVMLEMAIHDLAEAAAILIAMHEDDKKVFGPYRQDITEVISLMIDELGVKQ